MLYVNPVTQRFFQQGEMNLHAKGREQEAFRELEHFFLYTLLQEMRRTIPEGGLFKKSAESKMFDEMLDDALSLEMAKSGQLGIAKLLEEQLRIQDVQRELNVDTDLRQGLREAISTG